MAAPRGCCTSTAGCRSISSRARRCERTSWSQAGRGRAPRTRARRDGGVLRLDGEPVEDAAWEWHDPPPDAPPLAGLLGFRWDALERWLEEDEEAVLHARDPSPRVDVLDTSRRVRAASTASCSPRPT